MYYARVTKTPNIDLERKTSLHFTDEKCNNRELEENEIVKDGYVCIVTKGLCGYEMESNEPVEAIEELKEFFDSEYIPFDGSFEWHIFEGIESDEYLPDGDLFIPTKIIY